MKSSRRKRVFSIILVPPGGRKPRSFGLGKKGMLLATVVAGVVIGLFVFSLSTLNKIGRLSVSVSQLERENSRLREEKAKLATLEDEFIRLKNVERKLIRLLGIEEKETVEKLPASSAGLLGPEVSDGAGSSGRLPTVWPVRGEISRGFSKGPRGHKGIDIAVAKETPVRAAGDGTVDFAGDDEIFGKMVIVNHGSGISSLYGHNSRLAVRRGDSVWKGQVVAYSGSSGRSSAPHLHFEISRYGKQVDPLTFLSEQ